MNNKDVKLLRGQIRQIVKELLPEILTEELGKALSKEVAEAAKGRLDEIAAQVATGMARIETKSKDTLSYILRQMTAVTPQGNLTQGTVPNSTAYTEEEKANITLV